MKPLPMPIRVAAGLVATVLEEAEHLPRRLTELPVTAVSQALQHAMRVQQKVTDLAIKGDRALGSLRPVPETPTWARFDEDEEPAPHNFNGRYDDDATFSAPYPAQPPKVTPVRILSDLESADGADVEDGADLDTDFGADREPVPEVPAPRVPAGQAETAGPTADVTPEPRHEATKGPRHDTKKSEPAASGPPGFDGYDDWSLAQLRARFRSLKPHQLQALLDWESDHRQRPPYLTMLSNRIASVTGQ
jgi:hypothetical protein